MSAHLPHSRRRQQGVRRGAWLLSSYEDRQYVQTKCGGPAAALATAADEASSVASLAREINAKIPGRDQETHSLKRLFRFNPEPQAQAPSVFKTSRCRRARRSRKSANNSASIRDEGGSQRHVCTVSKPHPCVQLEGATRGHQCALVAQSVDLLHEAGVTGYTQRSSVGSQ